MPIAESRITTFNYHRSITRSQRYSVWANNAELPVLQTPVADYAIWSQDGNVDVRVSFAEPTARIVVRPLSRDIAPGLEDGEITFLLREPAQLCVDTPQGSAHPPALFTIFSITRGSTHD